MAPPITLKQLRYVVAVADQRHFGRAAAACRISQPSLSAQIQQLEEMLGTRLFERTRRRVLLTDAGAALVERARRVLDEADELVAAARRPGAPLSGEFRLGVIPTLGPYLLPRVLPALRRTQPTLRLFLREDLTERLLERLEQGGLDAALVALPLPAGHDGLEAAPLFDEPFLVAVPPEHALAAAPTVREADLAGQRLLLLEDGHCFRDQALAVCRRNGPVDAEGFAATSLETLREMVAGGIGLTLLPRLAANGAAGVAVRPFDGAPPSRRIGLTWRGRSTRAPEGRLLAGLIRANLPPEVTPAE